VPAGPVDLVRGGGDVSVGSTLLRGDSIAEMVTGPLEVSVIAYSRRGLSPPGVTLGAVAGHG
jgi:hypothetical protein